MPPRSLKTEISPTVFRWLRESAGWSIEEVAKRLKTSDIVIEAIENGKRNPSLHQLKELSNAYKRPLAAFFLAEPVKEAPMPKDYRMLPDKVDVFDKKTIYTIRIARSLQEIGGELSGNINYATKTSLSKASIGEAPGELAARYREMFRLTEKKQKKFKTPYELFNYLRNLFEDLNILVFQFSMPVEDARGFALTDRAPNVIVINTKDGIEARLFSLMHEFGHILLGETVIDIPNIQIESQSKVEQWCNTFSSEFLLPSTLAKEIFHSKEDILTETKTLGLLSRRYKVSKAMLLYNMHKLDFITSAQYKKTLERYKPPEPGGKEKERAEKQGGGIPQDKKCLSRVGNKFVSLVANNYDRNYITYTDALNYLSIKSKNFDKVLAQARK